MFKNTNDCPAEDLIPDDDLKSARKMFQDISPDIIAEPGGCAGLGVNRVQSGLNEIYAELSGGKYDLPQAHREKYLPVISHAAAAAGSLLFSGAGAGMETQIAEMIALLRVSFSRYDEEAAREVTGMVAESIDYLSRTDILWSGLEERERLSRQEKAIDRLNLMAQVQIGLSQINKKIRELEHNQARYDHDYESAQAQLGELKSSHPSYEDELKYYKEHGGIPDKELLVYIRHMDRCTRFYHLSRENALILEQQLRNRGKLEDMLAHLNMMVLGTLDFPEGVCAKRLRSQYSIGILQYDETGKPVIDYAIRYQQNIVPDRIYFHLDADGELSKFYLSGRTIDSVLINTGYDDRCAAVRKFREEYRQKLNNLVSNDPPIAAVGFSVDVSGTITIWVQEHNGCHVTKEPRGIFLGLVEEVLSV